MDEYIRRKRVHVGATKQTLILEDSAIRVQGSYGGERSAVDHETGRGSGGSKRDDRDRSRAEPTHGVAHAARNIWKASRVIRYHEEDGG